MVSNSKEEVFFVTKANLLIPFLSPSSVDLIWLSQRRITSLHLNLSPHKQTNKQTTKNPSLSSTTKILAVLTDYKHPIFIVSFCISGLQLLEYTDVFASIWSPCIHFVCFITLDYTTWNLTYFSRLSLRIISPTKPSLVASLVTGSFPERASMFCAASVTCSLSCLLLYAIPWVSFS